MAFKYPFGRIALKFTPLEFETLPTWKFYEQIALKFTPLEFETVNSPGIVPLVCRVKIYSVGV